MYLIVFHVSIIAHSDIRITIADETEFSNETLRTLTGSIIPSLNITQHLKLKTL